MMKVKETDKIKKKDVLALFLSQFLQFWFFPFWGGSKTTCLRLYQTDNLIGDILGSYQTTQNIMPVWIQLAWGDIQYTTRFL